MVAIWMHGQLVGHLTGRPATIECDDAYRELRTATPISLSLPLGAGVHTGEKVTNYLWGLLPDNPLVIERWAADFQVSSSDVVGLLRHVGQDVAGAAQYVPDGDTPEAADPGGFEPRTEVEIGELLADVERDAAAWHRRGRSGRWSLAGAQAKIALSYFPDRGWGEAYGALATTHIIKPAIDGLTDHDLNEHLCLAAASKLGMDAASTTVTDFAGHRALVVKRYDRVASADGGIIRVHQEDACQALGIHPAFKYQSDGGPSLEAVADLIRSVEIVNPTRDVWRYLRAVAYNWLILGTDAHAKNFSLLLAERNVRLAPMYDIASALPYGEHPKRLKLAQKIGGEYAPTKIEARHWDRVANAVRVPSDRLRTEVLDLATRLPDAMADAVHDSQATGFDGTLQRRLVDGLAQWTKQCVIGLHRPVTNAVVVAPSSGSQGRIPAGNPGRGGRYTTKQDTPPDGTVS